ncbi:MAG: hypothetical protein E6R03_15020 [Hyphomicrobiaceae bacterium]|nr:MAG: hypothetical protein E6R03_15020 [Hyphomicrobiaceae bacterium]
MARSNERIDPEAVITLGQVVSVFNSHQDLLHPWVAEELLSLLAAQVPSGDTEVDYGDDDDETDDWLGD